MGEVPHKCPLTCGAERNAALLGCRGPVEHPIFHAKLMDGTMLPVHECPHRMLRDKQDVVAAINWFFAHCETGVLPNAGGWCEQSKGFDDVRSICGAIRGRVLEERSEAARRQAEAR